ncbi:MAG: hypothetical protein SW833_25595 [Cyanobacteriota bacterium]|nr:hypothetical protein [Cyanobacteriota bacterium]
MRYWSLWVGASVLVAGAMAGETLAQEAIAPSNSVEVAQDITIAENEFWARSQALIAEQFQILQQLEEAMIFAPSNVANPIQLNGRNLLGTPQSQRQQQARENLWLHLVKLERYLRDRSIMPQFLCRDGVLPRDYTPAQHQVYCSLYYAQQQLEPLVPFLDRPTSLLAPVELATTTAFSPENETAKPVVIGQPAKAPEAGEPLYPSASIPNAQALYAIETSRRLLLTAREVLPSSRDTPGVRVNTGETNYFALYPDEARRYEDVLAQPNTGIATLFNAPPSPLDLNQLRDRLAPAVASPLPLVPLETLAKGFIPRLTLKVEGDTLIIPADSLTYGFIADLGDDTDFEDFPDFDDGRIDWDNNDFDELSSAQRELFRNYRPPERLQAIQADQRRFLFDKLGLDILPEARPPAVAYARMERDRTYLLRLVQYQLPEVVLNDEPIARSRRRHAGRILETPSSDLLIAFRPIRQDPDGSYVVLWKIVKRFPNPEISDLKNYVTFE